MQGGTDRSVPGLVAVAALGAFAWLGGWLIAWPGVWEAQPHRRSQVTLQIDGPGAFAMASILFVLACLAGWVLVDRRPRRSAWRVAVAIVVLVPPLVRVIAARLG